jgi:hypothetical protein
MEYIVILDFKDIPFRFQARFLMKMVAVGASYISLALQLD